jgi:signal transduction histidine kinase
LGFVSGLLAKTLRSSTFKLALLCIGVFGAVVLALFAYVYWSTTSYVLTRSDRSIEAERMSLHEVYASAGRERLAHTIEEKLAQASAGEDVYLLADPSFARIAGNLKTWPQGLKNSEGWANIEASDGDAALIGRLLRVRFETLPDGSHLLIGKNVDELGRFTNRIYWALALAISLILGLAVLASMIVTRRTVGRIESVNSTSRAILKSGLGERIPLRGTQDEWDQLAANLNVMLDRIEVLMSEVRQVGDNVAHDLRTPLTRMRGRLEKACISERVADNDQLLISDTIADLDDVLRMFSSLTRISQIETTRRTAAFRAVDLVEVAREVVELFDAAAEDKGSGLKVIGERPVFITGDRDLLFDATGNLVDNAIKHGREAGRVLVEISESNGDALISVSDDGPGIPEDEYENVFKRFYRLERSRYSPGNGLGLGLVAAVARLHGARIEMADNSPGLKITLRFPLAEGLGESMRRQESGAGWQR